MRPNALRIFRRLRGDGQILAGLAERDLWPALHGQLKIDPARGEVHQLTRMIKGQIFVATFAEFGELLGIVAMDPSRRSNRHSLEDALHGIFILQAEGNHFELQLPYGTQNRIVVAQRPE